MENNNTINEFRGEYAFLSNFYETEIYCWGYKYRNAEAAFQAMKDPLQASAFVGLDAKAAKRLGRKVCLRKNWEQLKEGFMYTVCFAKFTQNPKLGEKLAATGDKTLIEGNTWSDVEWGVCNGKGKNLLGNILMKVREKIKNKGDNFMDKKNQLEVEKEYLAKLHKLRDFIWGYFDKTDDIYNSIMRLTEEAIADKIDDIAILRGCKLVKTNKRKKYVFEVGRERVGGADVYLNGEKIWSFPDEIVKVEKNDVIFTDIVKGMGSRMPDAAFVKALFFTPLGEKSNLSDRVRAIFDRDIPSEILETQRKNCERDKRTTGGD